MNETLSEPLETLLGESSAKPPGPIDPIDVLIVGSGYGGSMAAVTLAGEGRRVVLLERGREYALGDFPVDLGEIPRHVRFQRTTDAQPIGYMDALFDLHFGEGMDALVGSGLGGTSLINANVAAEPDADVLADPVWPAAIRMDDLGPHFRMVKKLIGVATRDGFAKGAALGRLAECLGTTARPAPIAVTFGLQGGSHPNAVGIPQSSCTLCGNCITGCNVGAKNTLAMNALPLARARGARLYTNATVVSVRREAKDKDYPWRVRVKRTLAAKTPLEAEPAIELRAKVVILAAGTLGSTGILQRSVSRGELTASAELGNRFSGNGDAIAFGMGQANAVNAIGTRDPYAPAHPAIGPTITSISRPDVEWREGEKTWRQRITLEDGAGPYPLARVLRELVTTAAMIHRLPKAAWPAWHKATNHDPISASEGASRHTQVLLAMGDDGSPGKLDLVGQGDEAHVRIDYSAKDAKPVLKMIDAALRGQDRDDGFDGGQYVPNPLWQLVPPAASSALSGATPEGRALTVHPLGGCCMGETAADGVVDDMGCVFDGQGGKHEGLHVLDGAIMPRALGINPFLTISAVSRRAALAILEECGWKESILMEVGAPAASTLPPNPVPRLGVERPVDAVVKERLIGKLSEPAPDWFMAAAGPHGTRLVEDKGFILNVSMHLDDVARRFDPRGSVAHSLDDWIERGPGTFIHATAEIYANSVEAITTKRSQMYHTPDDDILPDYLVATSASGRIRLLAPDVAGGWLSQAARMWEAFMTYRARRLTSFTWAQVKGAFAFLQVVRMHTTYRLLEYDFTFTFAHEPSKTFTLRGTKRLAWRRDESRLWDALFVLPATIEGERGSRGKVALDVDARYLATAGAPQVVGSPHLPASVAAMSAFGLVFLRSIFQTHFWDFGAPDYKKMVAPDLSPFDPELRVGPERVKPVVIPLKVNRTAAPNDYLDLKLTRYPRPDGRSCAPVLLVHGLAQGGLIYTQPMLDKNMAEYFWETGYDVWVLDYRLSNNLEPPIDMRGWTIDEIGEFDIPQAIEKVYDECKQQPIRLFAHCVGATGTAMAILKKPGIASKLHCVAFNAIHPWIMPSPANEFRALLGSFFKDVLLNDPLNPLPSKDPSAAETIVDRIAFSLSRFGEMKGDAHPVEEDELLVQTVCDRMSFLYGRMWRHSNLDHRTHEAFPRIMGPAPGDVYRHLFYFSTRNRVTNREGQNVYLTDENLERWTVPTLFVHGEDSQVFNPQSATRSAVRLDAIINRQAAINARGYEVPVAVKRFEGYGHMDVVFAKTAHETSFPFVASFFANPMQPQLPGETYAEEEDPHLRDVAPLTCGPILRAAWIDGGAFRVRLWGEHTADAASLINGLAIDCPWTSAPRSLRIDPHEPRYNFLEVDIPANPSEPVQFTLQANDVGGGIVGGGITMGGAVPTMTPMANHALAPTPANQPPFETSWAPELPWLSRLRTCNPTAPVTDMRFLVGSCRYPGTPFEARLADAVYGGMHRHVVGGDGLPGVHHQFLIGDQIYADATANILDTSAWRERFGDRYREAFVAPNMSKLLSMIPTHFAIDDHEISDNWSGVLPGDAKALDERDRALQCARNFMTSGRGTASPFWYALDPARERTCPTFVMDTRSERQPRLVGGNVPRMVSAAQFNALAAWLQTSDPDAPKFIFMGCGIAPISREAMNPDLWRTQDGWLGYPEDLKQLGDLLVRADAKRVILVSGDLHLSAYARVTFENGGKSTTCHHLVSSGLYAPMPFANAQPRDYEWGTQKTLRNVTAVSWLLHSGESHFMRVDAEARNGRWTLAFGIRGVDGRLIQPPVLPPPGVQASALGWVVDL